MLTRTFGHSLKSLFNPSRPSRSRQRRRSALHSTEMYAAIEQLEDRTLLSTGALDLSFGDNGKVITNFPGSESDSARDVAVQADGKIVAVGAATKPLTGLDFGIVRYNQDGSLDNSFGDNGLVTTHFAENDVAHSVAIDASGRIIVVGVILRIPDTSNGFNMARYNPDGSLDTTFANNGRVVGFNFGYWGNEVGFDGQGRILIAGVVR